MLLTAPLIPCPTVLATPATPLRVFDRNSLPRPSPFGAQVCSHACALFAAVPKASEDDDEAERVRCGSAGGMRKDIPVGVVEPLNAPGEDRLGRGLAGAPKARRGGSAVRLRRGPFTAMGAVILRFQWTCGDRSMRFFGLGVARACVVAESDHVMTRAAF